MARRKRSVRKKRKRETMKNEEEEERSGEHTNQMNKREE